MVASEPRDLAKTVDASDPGATIRPDLPTLTYRPDARTNPLGPREVPRIDVASEAPDGAEAGDTADLMVRGTLGEGGMGRVLLAWQTSLARDVAVKTVKFDSEHASDLLLAEGRLTGALEHPAIVPVHALGRGHDGAPMLVMKRIDGVSLSDLIANQRHEVLRLLPGGHEDPLQGFLWVLSQVCNALHFAHSRGVVHRDIKPDNIMVGGFGEVYLLDWGIAVEADPEDGPARSHDLAGTPSSMAPEMAEPGLAPIGPRTDVYLLGATLYEVLTGFALHRGDTIPEVLEAARRAAPPRLPKHAPAELAALCVRATARDPSARPESALRFRQALDDYLQHRGAEALAASAAERLDTLRALVAAPGGDRTAVGRAAIECRFAFELAQRAWPESPSATEGRAQCLSLMFEEAIRQRQAVEAAVILGDMRSPDVAVAARLRALEAELQRERSEAEAARRTVRESDQRIGARARMAAGLTVLSLGLAVSWSTQGLRLPTHRETVVLMSVVLALLLAVIGVLRRHVLSNLYSRRVVGLLVFLTAMYLVHRVVGWVHGVPVPDVLLGEMMIAGVIPGAAVVLGYRNVLGGALISFAGVAAAIVWPQHVALIHPVAIVGAQVVYLAVGVEQDQGMTDPFRP